MTIDKELLIKVREFQKYISSPEWIQLRQLRLEKDYFRCVRCKSVDNLTCHHWYYGRLYKEKIDDVITLCGKCHTWVHMVSPPKDIPLHCQNIGIEKVYFNMGIEEMQDIANKKLLMIEEK